MSKYFVQFLFLFLIASFTFNAEARVCHPIERLYNTKGCDYNENIHYYVRIPVVAAGKDDQIKHSPKSVEIPEKMYDYQIEMAVNPNGMAVNEQNNYEPAIESNFSSAQKLRANPEDFSAGRSPDSDLKTAKLPSTITDWTHDNRIPINYGRYDISSNSHIANSFRRKRDLSKMTTTTFPPVNTGIEFDSFKEKLIKLATGKLNLKGEASENSDTDYNIEGIEHLPDLMSSLNKGQYSCYKVPYNGNQEQIVCQSTAPPEVVEYEYDAYAKSFDPQLVSGSVSAISADSIVDSSSTLVQSTPSLKMAATVSASRSSPPRVAVADAVPDSLPMASDSQFVATRVPAPMPNFYMDSRRSATLNPAPSYMGFRSAFQSPSSHSQLPSKQSGEFTSYPNMYYSYEAKDISEFPEDNVKNIYASLEPSPNMIRKTPAPLHHNYQHIIEAPPINEKKPQRPYFKDLFAKNLPNYYYNNRDTENDNGSEEYLPRFINKYKIVPLGMRSNTGGYIVQKGQGSRKPIRLNRKANILKARNHARIHDVYLRHDRIIPINEELSS